MAFKSIFRAVCAFLIIASFSSHAALIGVLPSTPGGTDYRAYYDDVADLTWLKNANAMGPGNNFLDANLLATSFSLNGIIGWRLPATLQPDASCSTQNGAIGSYDYNCTGSEMGNMFYNVLGGAANQSIASNHNANYDLFTNIRSGWYYSSTELAIDDRNGWVFMFNDNIQSQDGRQAWINKGFSGNVWIVHDGNVGEVPVPAAVWLFGSGLIGLIGVARRKKA